MIYYDDLAIDDADSDKTTDMVDAEGADDDVAKEVDYEEQE